MDIKRLRSIFMTMRLYLDRKSMMTLFIIIASTIIIYKRMRKRQILRQLMKKGIEKRRKLNAKCALLSKLSKTVSGKTKNKILSWTATQIRQQIIDGNVTCNEVIITFCLASDKANKRVNALFEKHYESAIELAQNLDKKLSAKRKESKEALTAYVSSKHLLGIPISVKDVFKMKASDSTNGILFGCNDECQSNGSAVKMILANGGIPFVKTSVPQLLMISENWNNIIGDTLNAHNSLRSSGGSSGGEGAIIGAKGSILGIGGDIGGSLRIPAHFNGIIAYKPSSLRSLKNGKIWYNERGKGEYCTKLAIMPAVGPMARSMDDIVLFLKAMWSPITFSLDVYHAPIPFKNEIYTNSDRINIGYWANDGWFSATKCVKRAIELCVNGLSSHYKYNLIPMQFNDGANVCSIYMRYMFAEGNLKKCIRCLHGEPLHSQFKMLKFYADIPNVIKQYLAYPFLNLIGEKRKVFLAKQIAKNGGLNVRELENEMYKIMQFRYEFWEWVDSYSSIHGKIDVLLSPVCYFPALPLGFSKYFAPSLTATFLQNLLDCAAGTVGPITFVQKDECEYDIESLPDFERDSMSKKLNEYMKGAEGLPISVQVFGRPFDDEIVLRVMKELEGLFVDTVKK